MSLYNPPSELPGAKSLYNEEDLEKLREHLRIMPQDQKSSAPVALRMQRSREIELKWGDFQGRLELAPTSNDFIRDYFHHSWGLGEQDEVTKKLEVVKKWLRQAAPEQYYRNLTPAQAQALGLEGLPSAGPWQLQEVSEGTWIIEHRPSGRVYELLYSEGNSLSPDDLKTWEKYENAWRTIIVGVRMIAPFDPVVAATVFPCYEEIDLGPAVISKEWRELAERETFTKALSLSADKIATRVTETELTPQQADALLSQYLNLKLRYGETREMAQRLADRANDLGYYLHIDEDMTFTPPGQSNPIHVTRGSIWRRYLRLYHWTTTETQIERVRVLVPHISLAAAGLFIQRPSQKMTTHWEWNWAYQRVTIDWDPWVEKEEALQRSGLNVFRMTRTDSGYITASGATLEEVMIRCDADEDFRRHCVVMLPKYEPKLTVGEIITGYGVYYRPLKGLTPIAFPRMFIQDTLAYKTCWKSTELGSLLNSINLAPDEERRISVSRSIDLSSEFKRTATSVLDLTETRSLDLCTEMENEARHEEDKNSSSNWNVRAGFSVGPFNAGGGGGGTNNLSVKDFARNLNKLAQKAASSITRKTRQEVTSSQTTTIKSTTLESVEFKVKNINQGRTLNLMFYQINNHYSGATYLEDINWVLLPTVEIISGSGILVPKAYSKDELLTAFRDMERMPLPLAVDTNDIAYRRTLLEKFISTVKKEYFSKESSAGIDRPVLEAVDGINWDALKVSPDSGQEEIDKLITTFCEKMRNAINNEDPICVQPIVFPSMATYLDSLLGILPATEPYSEEMRLQEARLRAANVYKEYAKGFFNESKAQQLSGNVRGHLPGHTGPLRILSVDCQSIAPGLIITLSSPLPPGKWRYEHDSGKKIDLSEWCIGRCAFYIPIEPSPVEDRSALPYRIRLYEKDTKQTVAYDVGGF